MSDQECDELRAENQRLLTIQRVLIENEGWKTREWESRRKRMQGELDRAQIYTSRLTDDFCRLQAKARAAGMDI